MSSVTRGAILLAIYLNLVIATPAQASAQSMAYYYINDVKEYKCFNRIVWAESEWRHTADNKRSSAYGLGQLLNEKSKDAFEQILNAVAYGRHRYGTLCRAAAFHRAHGWW